MGNALNFIYFILGCVPRVPISDTCSVPERWSQTKKGCFAEAKQPFFVNIIYKIYLSNVTLPRLLNNTPVLLTACTS